MFRTDLLSTIRSLNTVFTAVGICHATYVDCLLARSGWNWPDHANRQSTQLVWKITFAVNTVLSSWW